MEWKIVLYGQLNSNGGLFVIQKCGELFSLWITEECPDPLNYDAVCIYMKEGELDGWSITGTREDVFMELIQ